MKFLCVINHWPTKTGLLWSLSDAGGMCWLRLRLGALCGLDRQALSWDLDVYTALLTLALIQVQFRERDSSLLVLDMKTRGFGQGSEGINQSEHCLRSDKLSEKQCVSVFFRFTVYLCTCASIGTLQVSMATYFNIRTHRWCNTPHSSHKKDICIQSLSFLTEKVSVKK